MAVVTVVVVIKLKYQINEQFHDFIVDDVLGIVHKKISICSVQNLTTHQHQHYLCILLPQKWRSDMMYKNQQKINYKKNWPSVEHLLIYLLLFYMW